MADAINITVDDATLVKSIEEFKQRLPAATKDGRLRFARYMRTEISRRVKASEDPERGTFLGILYTSRKGLVKKGVKGETKAVGVERLSKRDKRFYGGLIRKEKLRAPLSVARPLLWKQGRLSKTAIHIDDENTIRIAPIVDFAVYHHRPEFTQHTSKGIMPDRSFFYTTRSNEEFAVKVLENSVVDSLEKSFGR